MIISRSLWRKALVTVVAVVAFVSLYEVTILDSKYAARPATLREATALPAPGARLAFSATAYCKGITTASGVAGAERRRGRRSGAAAGRLGRARSIRLPRYNGIYTVLDTGPAVQGRQVDLYMWSCNEALAVRPPADSADGAAPRLEPASRRRRASSTASSSAPEPAPLPSRPLPQTVPGS